MNISSKISLGESGMHVLGPTGDMKGCMVSGMSSVVHCVGSLVLFAGG